MEIPLKKISSVCIFSGELFSKSKIFKFPLLSGSKVEIFGRFLVFP